MALTRAACPPGPLEATGSPWWKFPLAPVLPGARTARCSSRSTKRRVQHPASRELIFSSLYGALVALAAALALVLTILPKEWQEDHRVLRAFFAHYAHGFKNAFLAVVEVIWFLLMFITKPLFGDRGAWLLWIYLLIVASLGIVIADMTGIAPWKADEAAGG